MGKSFGEQFVSLFERSILCIKSDAEREVWNSTGRPRLVKWAEEAMRHGAVLQMVLPAFPFKSPNTEQKVLGTRPDAGEETALKALDAFCANVKLFYPAGARLVIFSDGRVFNDLLGVPDATVAEYNRLCREMVKTNNLTHISFDILENYVKPEFQVSQAALIGYVVDSYLDRDFDVNAAVKDGELKNTYLGFRSFLELDLGLRWAQSGRDGKPLSKKQVDSECKRISKLMIVRNRAFSELVAKEYPKHLRLSIHAGNVTGPKWSVSLINHKPLTPRARKCLSATPWHNVLVQEADGCVFAMRRCDVDLNRYELVERDNHAWAFCEKSNSAPDDASAAVINLQSCHPSGCGTLDSLTSTLPLLCLTENLHLPAAQNPPPPVTENQPDAPTTAIASPSPTILPAPADTTPATASTSTTSSTENPLFSEVSLSKWKHLHVHFEPLHPFGLMIKADPSFPPPSYFDIPADSLRELVCEHTTVLLRGFAPMTREQYIEGTRRIGPLVENPHGVVTDVQEVTDPKISVFTREAMPVHFDGMFRIKMDTSVDPPKPVADIPFMQIFQCAQPPSESDEGGITLFIDTRRILSTFDPAKVERLRHLNIGYYMPPSGMFGGKWMHFNVVDSHPITGVPILRIHEPWPVSKSEKFEILVKPTVPEEEPLVKQFFDEVIPLCFDDRFSFKQSWQKDDILLADNHAQLHTRTAYTTASRHLRRIHVQC